jgi:very-short-patch-repair endonuclease
MGQVGMFRSRELPYPVCAKRVYQPALIHAVCAKRVFTGWVGIQPASPHAEVVAPRPRIPSALKLGPFSLDEARAAGISRTALRGKSWRRVGRGLYCWTGLLEDPWKVLVAYQRLVPETVFAGCTAAWLHGIDLDPIRPIDVIVPTHSGIRSRRGLTVHHLDLALAEVARVRGLRVTNVYRTLADLCELLSEVDALIAIDGALRLRLIEKAVLDRARSSRLRWLGALAQPAESPMETRLRWLLFRAGLPRPQVQTPLQDPSGRFIGRADLYYSQARLVIEYDGVNHRDRLVEDNRRQNLLISAGFHLLRFTAGDIYDRPQTVAKQVRNALTSGVAVSATRPGTAPR